MPTSSPSAAERAFAHIRSAILGGELPPGTLLSENELAASLSMSRTPIRSALGRLQDEGWIRIYAKRGALVRQLTEHEVSESAEVRLALETAGVRLSGADARTAIAERLLPNLRDQQSALDAGDFAAFATHAMQFHRAFVRMSDNGLMLSIYDRLGDRQILSIVRSAPRITADPQLVLDEHRDMVSLASSGDWIAFAEALAQHQQRSRHLEIGHRARSAERTA